MMGLSEIKKANCNPRKHAMAQLSDGQERRNNSPPNAYWSEQSSTRPVADHTEPYHHQSENLAEMQVAPQVLTADYTKIEERIMQHISADTFFDAALLANVVEKRIKILKQQQAALAIAIGLARQSAEYLPILANAMDHINVTDPSLAIEAHVEMLSKQIDVAAPEPHGYTPHMGIQYALAPIKRTIAKMRDAFKHARA